MAFGLRPTYPGWKIQLGLAQRLVGTAVASSMVTKLNEVFQSGNECRRN
jgi:hypothetical protein